MTPNVSLCKDSYELHYNAKVEETNDPFNGHAYVDLGLPSGTLWATSPLTSSEGERLYFAWGDIEGWTATQVQNGEKSFFWDGSDYKYDNNSLMTKYNETDGKVVLDLEDDAAHVHMGGNWHMPTKEQFEELTANTTSTWTTQNGVSGRLFTSKVNGNSVFVPAFGNAFNGSIVNFKSSAYLWSSSLDSNDVSIAWYFGFNSSSLNINNGIRSSGLCVLGVVG